MLDAIAPLSLISERDFQNRPEPLSSGDDR
jgi:hypothetical protein